MWPMMQTEQKTQCSDCKKWLDSSQCMEENPNGENVCDTCFDEYVCCDDCCVVTEPGNYKNAAGCDICGDCDDDYTNCYDCDCVIGDDSSNPTNDTGHPICEDCSHSYIFDELTEETICEADAVSAEHCDNYHCRFGRTHTIWTHRDNVEYINGTYYTEDAVYQLFTDCIACDCRIEMEYSYHTDYNGPYCESCLPRGCQYYDGGSDVDPEESTFEEMTSSRTFGLELEYNEAADCASRNYGNGSHWFECKEDCSIDGEEAAEFCSPVLCGDAGLEAIRDFADCARSANPDNSCGFHLHVGISDLSEDQKAQLVRVMSKVEKVARMFVPASRSSDSFCSGWLRADNYSESATYHDLRNSDRYCGFNFRSYYGTVEVRFHQSTTCTDEMVNWVKLWVAVVDYVADGGTAKRFDGCSDQQIFNKLTKLAGRKIAEFYADRAEQYGYGESVKKEEISFVDDCPGQLMLAFAS